MTSTRVVIGDKFVCKRFDTPELVFQAIDRSAWVRRARAVLTPPASPHATDRYVVRFVRVHGVNLSVPGHTASCATHVNLLRILKELACFHSAPKLSVLPEFDALAKVRPRLSVQDRQRFAPLLHMVESSGSPISHSLRQQAVQLHGDAHPGQFITDSRGRTWVLDLDDMCIGPVEVDLANLAAYLATRHALSSMPPVATQFTYWRDAIMRSYPQSAEILPCMRAINFYGHLSLLRRFLKLRERGNSQVANQVSDCLRQICQSI